MELDAEHPVHVDNPGDFMRITKDFSSAEVTMNDIEVLRSFAVLNRAFLAFFSAALVEKQLTYSEGVIIANVGHRPGSTQDALAVELIIDKAAVARSVKLLKQKGLLRVKRSTDDGRANNLFLTRSGESVLRFIHALNETWIRSATSELAPGEFEKFSQTLARIVTRVRELPPSE